MILPTIAAVIADVLGLGPAHGIGPATRPRDDKHPIEPKLLFERTTHD